MLATLPPIPIVFAPLRAKFRYFRLWDRNLDIGLARKGLGIDC